MELIVERDGIWVDALQKFSLDMAQGDENDFELTYDGEIQNNSFVFVPGTSYGGIVDGVSIDADASSFMRKYYGRTWEGILQTSIIQPPSGQDYYIVSGDLYAVLRRIIERQGLAYAFEIPNGSYGLTVAYQFERYTNAYAGICKMLESVGLVPRFSKDEGLCVISVERPRTFENDGFDDYRFEISITDIRATNHLICLGGGELRNRLVRHLYMDANGNISTNQTQFGINEVQDVYDYPSAETEQDLIDGGKDVLADRYAQSKNCAVNVAEGYEYKIGDVVTSISANAGYQVTASITKTILTMDEVSAQVAYEVGAITSKAR